MQKWEPAFQISDARWGVRSHRQWGSDPIVQCLYDDDFVRPSLEPPLPLSPDMTYMLIVLSGDVVHFLGLCP